MENFKKLLISFIITLSSTSLYANITQEQCLEKGDEYLFTGGECIQFAEVEGDIEGSLNIIVHGTWPAGTNTLARYAPFAETISMNTDITTVAVALPGYSNSSTNNLQALAHKGAKNLSSDKVYIKFLNDMVISLKNKYKATKINYIGHSAGARIGATLVGYNPTLITTITTAGGSYNLKKDDKNNGSIALSSYIDNVKDTKFLLIYGTADKISKPEVTKNFYKIAKAKGIDVKIVEVEGAPHLDLDMTDESVDAITEMLEE